MYYRFETVADQDRHIENLIKLLGPAPAGRTLPKKFIELLEEEEIILFEQKD